MADDFPGVFDPLEDCPWRTPRDILARYGYSPLPPAELGERQLTGRLWELLYAAAARRFFFSDTNHLSDRELYSLLWDQWLDKPTADIPLEAETNTRITVSEFGIVGITSEELYLRYYADEQTRDLWREDFPDTVLPPHEEPPYDRDRFLPEPPAPLPSETIWVMEDEDEPEDAEDDPLGLASVDEEIASTNTTFVSETAPEGVSDPALEGELNAAEPENWAPPAQKLAEENIPLLPPAEITDDMLGPILWELIHNLALRGFYLLHTDHLSDRELYAELWQHGLREPAYLPGRNPRGGWFHDFVGGGGDQEMQLWLRYYADDEERARHASEWPDVPIPAKERPPHNRDWRLPKGPF